MYIGIILKLKIKTIKLIILNMISFYTVYIKRNGGGAVG
jgi:hypothetical protein